MASAAEPVAGIIDRIEDRRYGTGRPPLPTIRVVGTLRSFVRGGVRWRGPRAAADRARGSTLRRRPEGRGATALPRRVRVALVRMVRAGPEGAPRDVVVASRPVRAGRGGELTGPDPTDRGERGTEYHVVASTGGLPPGVVPSAADVHDTRRFPHLLRPARVVRAAVGEACADAGYDGAGNRGVRPRDGTEPRIREVGAPHGRGPGAVRRVVEHDCAWLLADERPDRRHDGLGQAILALPNAGCTFVVANRISPF